MKNKLSFKFPQFLQVGPRGAHGAPVLNLVGAVNRPETESAAQTHFLVSLEFSNRLGNVFLGNPERPSLVRMTVVQVDIEECLCSSHQCKNFFLRNALSNAPDPPSWTEWGSWSTCSQSCGGGQKHRERTCNSKNTLSPVHDVHTRIVNRPPDCPGNPRDTESCHNQDCPGRDYKGSRHVRKVQFF